MNIFYFTAVICLGVVFIHHSGSQTCPSGDVCWTPFNSSDNMIRLGIIADIHRAAENGQQCSKIIRRNVEMAESIRWIFSQLHAKNFIPGVAIDTVVLDACSREDVAIHELVSVFPNFHHPSCQQTVHGLFGLVSSSQSQVLAESLGRVNIPIISPTASAPSLSNTTTYPSFFRTVPPANSEVKVLYNIVKELGMQYIAVVYSDDAYGRESIKELEILAKDSVCIGGKFLVTDQNLMYNLIRLQDNLTPNIGNLPVLYVGDNEGAELLVESGSRDFIKEVSQRFLWIFGSSLDTKSDIFAGNTKLGRNVITISLQAAEVQEFTDYWSETLAQFLQSNTTRPHQWYYQEYLFDYLACSNKQTCLQQGIDSINQSYKQTSFLGMALDTAYIYAHALKTMHSALCSGQSGLCYAMSQRLQTNGNIRDEISRSTFTYDDTTFPFLPASLKNEGRTIRFHGNDISLTDPLYIIYNARCDQRADQCSFVNVGRMTGDVLDLNKQKIQFYLTPTTDEPVAADTLMPIYCQLNCEICVSNSSQELPYASIWGEFLIASFFSATQAGTDAFGCSDQVLIDESVDLLEAMLYSVDAFNGLFNHSNQIWPDGRPQLLGKLGIIAFNDCRNPLYAGQLLSNWLTGKLELRDRAGRLYDPDKCVAVIGGTTSSISLRLLPITKAANLLQVSATATSVQLEFNGSFLRTIPADDNQVRVMVDFVKRLGSTAFSVVYLDDSYGIKGHEELVKRAHDAELCISVAVKIPVNIKEGDVHDVLDRLRVGRPTRIVILFTVWREALTILKVANGRANKKEFVWIGTESWGNREIMVSDDTDPESLGAFTVLVPTESSLYFRQYLARLDPESNTRNPFFRTWWEALFNCKLPTKTAVNPLNKCPSGLSLPNNPEDLYADLYRKAVWSIGAGLATTVEKLCRSSRQFCPQLRTEQGLLELVNNVKKVEMTVFGEKRRLYTDRGDGNVDEDILNIQLLRNNRIYKQVARFHSSNGFIITSNYTFYNEDRNPVPVPYSTCTLCNCIFKHKDDPLIHLSKFIKIEGDMYLAAVLPVHSSTSSYRISMDGIVSLEALLYAVEMANARMGHKLGLIIYDGYGNRDLTDWHIVSLVNSGKYLGLEQYNINDSMIVAFLTASDQNSLITKKTATSNDIIHFDLGKSLFTTSNEGSYYFSLGYAVRSELFAIVGFLLHHRWSKVQLLCSGTSDSVEVCKMIQEMFQDKGICAIQRQTLDRSTYQTAADNVMYEVSAIGTDTGVVVALIEESDVAPFMDALGANNVRSSTHYPVFIGWSRFTNGVSLLSGTYKDVCNNSVGFQETVQTLTGPAEQVLQKIKTVNEDSKRNPWLTADIANSLRTNNLKSQYRIIDDTVEAANIMANALHDLLSAECSEGNGLCDELLRLPDWRKRLLRNVNNQFQRNLRGKTVFDVVTYVTDDVPDAPYRVMPIGEFDTESGRTRLKQQYILNNVTSSCQSSQCDVCDLSEGSSEFSPWGIAFLVIVPLLVIALAISAAVFIRDKWKRHKAINETYLYPDTVKPREHWKPPPLPSRDSQERRSHGITSVYNPGSSEASASSFISASSIAGDNRFSNNTMGNPRQPSGTSFYDGIPIGVLRDPPVSRVDRDESYLNPAFIYRDEPHVSTFKKPVEPNHNVYGMSLDLLPPDKSSEKRAYSHLDFENSDEYDDQMQNNKRHTRSSIPSVYASGTLPNDSPEDSNFGFVSSV